MKVVFYVIGIFILTLGIAFTIQSDLGTSPFDALLVGLSRHVGLTVGSWEIILAVLLIGCNSILQKRRPEVLGLLTSIITGVGIDLWLFLLRHFVTPELWVSKAVCFAVGLAVIGAGTALYLYTNFAPIPIDRLTLIIKELTKTNLFFSKTIIYLLFLLLALLLKGPIGIGTLLTVCLGGLILNSFMPLIEKRLDGVLKPSTTAQNEDKKHSI